jgi:hypothetical protein
MNTHFWPVFLLGMLSAFAISTALVGLIVWWEQRRKRREAFEQFENVPSDERYLSKITYPPSYGVRSK